MAAIVCLHYDEQWKACDEDSNSCVSKGSLKRLISRKKEEFGLGHDCIIPIETIWTQVKNKNFAVDCCGGHDSPLKELEDTIVDFLIAMSHCCQPLTTSKSLVLVNSLIQGTKYQSIVAEFQSKYCAGMMKATTKKGEARAHFWQNFMQQNSHRIVNKRGEKFAPSCTDWSTYENFVAMYDHIYKEMHAAGLTKEYKSPVMVNESRLIVDDINESYGMAVTHELIHSDYLLFMDQTGSNTNQKDDKNVGGQKFVCESGMTPKLVMSTSSHHFILILIVVATEDAVGC